MYRNLAAAALLVFPMAAFGAGETTTGEPITVTLQATLNNTIAVTIDGRTALSNVITGTSTSVSVAFGGVAINNTGTGAIGTDKRKFFHTSDSSATFVAELQATMNFTGTTQVVLEIVGGTATGQAAGYFQCDAPVASPTPTTFTWETTPGTFGGGIQATATAATCATYAVAGANYTAPVDLALHLPASANGTNQAFPFTFQYVPSP